MKTSKIIFITFCVILLSSCKEKDCIDDKTLTPEEKAIIPYNIGDTAYFKDQLNNQYYLTCTSIKDSVVSIKEQNDPEGACDYWIHNYSFYIKYFKSNLPRENNSFNTEIYIANNSNSIGFYFKASCNQALGYNVNNSQLTSYGQFSSVSYEDSLFINTQKYYDVYLLYGKPSTHYCSYYDTIYFNFQDGFLKFVSTKNNLVITIK